MPQRPAKIVWGAGSIWAQSDIGTVENVQKIFDILSSGNVASIDTGRMYPGVEDALGAVVDNWLQQFEIDTKAAGGVLGAEPATTAQIMADYEQSKAALKLSKPVDIYYIHAFDSRVPLEETLEGINQVYHAGFFKRFGLSNFTAEQIRLAHQICKDKYDFVPTVYQGLYGAMHRAPEKDLFPVLRELNMAFYAFSPTGGGLLGKSKAQVLEGKGRWDTSTLHGQIIAGLFAKPKYLDRLAEWADIAKEENISGIEMAFRWIRYHSALGPDDAVVFGATSVEQTAQTVKILAKGPLSEKAVAAIETWSKNLEEDQSGGDMTII